MKKPPTASRLISVCLRLLFSYALLVSTIAPFGPRTVHAGRVERADKSEVSFPSSTKTQAREGEVLVRFRAGASEQEKANVAVGHGNKRRKLRGESGVEKLDLPSGKSAESAALELAQEPSVEFAEPNFLIKPDQLSPSAEVVPNDSRFSEQWSLRNTGQSGGRYGSDIGMPKGWHTSTGAQATVIAVIDSGIDFTHPDLANNEWTNPGPTNEDLHGWDYIADSPTIKDEQGHGTAVAGIIAARGNNADGVSGVMWQASLMSLRVLDNTGTGDIASAVEAIDYAVAHGAQVINLSWGTNNSSVALKSAIDRATKRGVVVVCSAGNDGQNIDATPYYPASFNSKGLISVAATGNTDQLASWSNWGNRTVAVAAPGSNILTTQMGGGYWSVTGTSAAAPLVTGVAGLTKSLRPSLSAAQVRSAIESNSRELSQLSSRVSSGGIVNAGAALSAVESNSNGNGNQGGAGNGNGNGNPYGQGDRQSTPGPYVPPGLRSDNSEGRANGKDGLHAKPPASITGAPQANLPNLDEARKVRTSPKTSATTTAIHSNMMLCADCGPGAGGGSGGSDPYLGTARSRPENETGDPGVKLGSRNFNWSLPLVGLKGRAGLDLSISLFYNSLVWTKQGSSIQYNADHGTPAPGFQMGLPRLQARYFNSDAGAYAYMMITPSGGRVEMKQVGTSAVYESSDNGYTQLTFSGSIPVVKTTDGTQYMFGIASAAEWRCTKIEDRNGNYISATYDATSGHVLTMTDTLGRTLNFGYDGDNNLSTITQAWGGVTHSWATFIYAPLSMSYSFSGLTPIGATNGGYQTVLSYVSFSDNTSYHFDYNSYGQVYQIRHKAPDGHELEHTWYNFDLSQAQTDCPRFTDKREYAQDWNNGQEAITLYSVTNGASWTTPETSATQTGTLVQQTAPDGTIYKEYSHATGWDAGLGRLTEFWSGGSRKKYTSTSWTSDNTGVSYPLNPRVTEVNTYDDASNRRRTTIEYNSGYSLPTHIREYANDGQTLLRMTATAYKMDSVYIDKRIIGLPYERVVYDGASGNPVSRSLFLYDWADPYFSAQAPSTNYDSDNYPSSSIVGRGNLVAVFRYDCSTATTAYDDNLGIWSERYGYNMAGSMIWSQDAAGNRTNLSYSDAFSVDSNNGRNTLAYVTQVTDPEGNSSTAEYNYDFGAVTRTHAPTSGITPYRTFVDEIRTYDGYGRLDRVTNDTNHSYTRFVYDANANFVHTYQTLIDLTTANEFHSWQVFDGAGRVRATAADHAGTTDHYDG
ncbi:MAG: S8 family peptidase, partial [bacterium]